MLLRYNAESLSPCYDDSWICSADILNPSKDTVDSDYAANFVPWTSLPRMATATVQRHLSSTSFPLRKSLRPQSEHIDYLYQRANSEDRNSCRYNVPLQERFYRS